MSDSIVFLDRDTLDAAGDIDFTALNSLGEVILHPVSRAGEIPGRVAGAGIVDLDGAIPAHQAAEPDDLGALPPALDSPARGAGPMRP